MTILNSQDAIIRQVFPDYNREKSSVIFEFGNGCDCDFIVKIYRKGTHRFDVQCGVVTNHKKIK